MPNRVLCESADTAELHDERYFFNMMIKIAKDMNSKTHALRPGFVGKIKVLDIWSVVFLVVAIND